MRGQNMMGRWILVFLQTGKQLRLYEPTMDCALELGHKWMVKNLNYKNNKTRVTRCQNSKHVLWLTDTREPQFHVMLSPTSGPTEPRPVRSMYLPFLLKEKKCSMPCSMSLWFLCVASSFQTPRDLRNCLPLATCKSEPEFSLFLIHLHQRIKDQLCTEIINRLQLSCLIL